MRRPRLPMALRHRSCFPLAEVIRPPSQRRFSCDLAAVAARSPRTRATRATLATRATTPTSAAAATAPTSAAAAATPTPGQLHAAAKVFPIEQMERGETDVGHFLFAKNEAVIGRGIVRLRDTGSGRRGCGCTTHQRKTESGGTEHFHGGGFGCALPLRSLLDPWHGRILRKFL
jgi:hypothetical protein